MDFIQARFFEELPKILDADRNVVAGAILFCAAPNGALSTRKRLEALSKAGFKDITVQGGICLVDLGAEGWWIPTNFPEALLRFFNREFTLPLIAHESCEKSDVEAVLYAQAETLDLSSADQRVLATRLPALCKFGNSINVPGYLLAYLNATNPATPLAFHGWQRVLSGQPADSIIPTSVSNFSSKAPRRPRFNNANAGPREMYCLDIQRTLDELASHVRTMSVSEAIQRIGNVRSSSKDTWPVQNWLADYAIHLIRETDSKRAAFSSIGGCKNFCVNGHLAGDCRASRSDDGRSKESSTQGVAR